MKGASSVLTAFDQVLGLILHCSFIAGVARVLRSPAPLIE